MIAESFGKRFIDSKVLYVSASGIIWNAEIKEVHDFGLSNSGLPWAAVHFRNERGKLVVKKFVPPFDISQWIKHSENIRCARCVWVPISEVQHLLKWGHFRMGSTIQKP